MTAKTPPTPKKPKATPPEVELEPDAWERFERTVDRVVRVPANRKAAANKTPSQVQARKPAF